MSSLSYMGFTYCDRIYALEPAAVVISMKNCVVNDQELRQTRVSFSRT
jgi:hypothetical protein